MGRALSGPDFARQPGRRKSKAAVPDPGGGRRLISVPALFVQSDRGSSYMDPSLTFQKTCRKAGRNRGLLVVLSLACFDSIFDSRRPLTYSSTEEILHSGNRADRFIRRK